MKLILLEYMGILPVRLHFCWISSAASTQFVDAADRLIEAVGRPGHRQHTAQFRNKKGKNQHTVDTKNKV